MFHPLYDPCLIVPVNLSVPAGDDHDIRIFFGVQFPVFQQGIVISWIGYGGIGGDFDIVPEQIAGGIVFQQKYLISGFHKFLHFRMEAFVHHALHVFGKDAFCRSFGDNAPYPGDILGQVLVAPIFPAFGKNCGKAADKQKSHAVFLIRPEHGALYTEERRRSP